MKLKIIVMALMFSLMLMACQQTEVTKLDTPSGFSIEDTIINFDTVEHASKYRIEVLNTDTQDTKLYVVTQNQNLDLLYFAPGTYEIKLQALGDGKNYSDSDFTTSLTYVQRDPYQISEIEKEFLTDPIKVNWLGRHSYQTATDANYFYFTASGFEVKFFGTSLTAELVTGVNATTKQPHLVVFIDGETNPENGTLIVMDQVKKNYTLAADLSEGVHTVRVVKRSESIDSLTGLSKLVTDGYFMDVDPLKDRKIEVIAASSSAGFGNLAASSGEAKTTQNSDGLRAYAYLAARMLDAEINIFSASGWPLVKGPWTADNNIPKAYEYVNVYSTVSWDHEQYEPDVVIINLGTNDWSYITTLPTADRTQAILNFESAYVDFIGRIHEIHPDAIIVVVYGLMNETNIYTPTENAVAQAKTAYPDLNLFSLQLPSVNASEGIGSSNHPGLLTHIRAGGVLAENLSVWLDWNIVYQNIDSE